MRHHQRQNLKWFEIAVAFNASTMRVERKTDDSPLAFQKKREIKIKALPAIEVSKCNVVK